MESREMEEKGEDDKSKTKMMLRRREKGMKCVFPTF